MKQSHYFLKTSKTVGSEDQIISSRLLRQAGYIRESVAGRYYMLPIAQRVQRKIMEVIKKEIDSIGGQEMLAPTLHPLELWKETNRTNTAGFELMKVVDRREAEFALGGTAEEMFVDLVRKFRLSYRDLPFHLYQFSNKFRDEMRARGGLLRVREFIMKDGYSFHRDEQDFQREYQLMKQVYTNIFSKLGLTTSIVESDNGYIGGEYCHEFIAESLIGESRYFSTADNSYAAHEDIAVFMIEDKNLEQSMATLEEVNAVRGPTMQDGVALHNLPLWQQLKDVLYVDEQGRFVLALIRGDLDVNEIKLVHAIQARNLRMATDAEIRETINSEPGFLSPVRIKEKLVAGTNLVIVADKSLRTVRNFYGGANFKDKDLLNVNLDRDFSVDLESDIAMVYPGAKSLAGHPLVEKRGIEVGNIFQLGYHYTKAMTGSMFTDEDGQDKPYYMGCYGIGIGRTLAAIVELHHDNKGIVWPDRVAPFSVHLLALPGKEPDRVFAEAEKLYSDLQQAGVEVLYDDRLEKTAGEKFADSDLIGIPVRLVISSKTLDQGLVEYKTRSAETAELLSTETVMEKIRQRFKT